MIKQQILMTRENPEGFKLEELAEKLCTEIQAETLTTTCHPSLEAQTVTNNNTQIIGLLLQIAAIQRQSFTVMAGVRAGEGPNGGPGTGV